MNPCLFSMALSPFSLSFSPSLPAQKSGALPTSNVIYDPRPPHAHEHKSRRCARATNGTRRRADRTVQIAPKFSRAAGLVVVLFFRARAVSHATVGLGLVCGSAVAFCAHFLSQRVFSFSSPTDLLMSSPERNCVLDLRYGGKMPIENTVGKVFSV